MGGSDEPNNLIELSIEQHAEAHKKLWEKYGCWQDKVAWKALSGQISISEAKKLAQIEGAKKGGLSSKNRKPTDGQILQGLKNVQSGHLDNIRNIDACIKGGKTAGIQSYNLKKGIFDPKNYGLGGKIGGKIGGKKACVLNILCHECGMITNAMAYARHSKKSGHIIKEKI